MSIYDRHNNFSKPTLERMTKKELIEYCLLLQKNLIISHESFDIHVKNVTRLWEEGEK